VSFVLAAAHHSQRTLDAAGLSDFSARSDRVVDASARFHGARYPLPLGNRAESPKRERTSRGPLFGASDTVMMRWNR